MFDDRIGIYNPLWSRNISHNVCNFFLLYFPLCGIRTHNHDANALNEKTLKMRHNASATEWQREKKSTNSADSISIRKKSIFVVLLSTVCYPESGNIKREKNQHCSITPKKYNPNTKYEYNRVQCGGGFVHLLLLYRLEWCRLLSRNVFKSISCIWILMTPFNSPFSLCRCVVWLFNDDEIQYRIELEMNVNGNGWKRKYAFFRAIYFYVRKFRLYTYTFLFDLVLNR